MAFKSRYWYSQSTLTISRHGGKRTYILLTNIFDRTETVLWPELCSVNVFVQFFVLDAFNFVTFVSVNKNMLLLSRARDECGEAGRNMNVIRRRLVAKCECYPNVLDRDCPTT